MMVYRLSKGTYKADLSGKGAELHGGRWNSRGIALVYTSQPRSLAFAEVAMHIPMGILPKNYFLITIKVPDDAGVLLLPAGSLPTDWRANPHPGSTQMLGDGFVAAETHLVLQAPSAVVPGDYNFLINPAHPEIKKIMVAAIEPFEFDSRMVAR